MYGNTSTIQNSFQQTVNYGNNYSQYPQAVYNTHVIPNSTYPNNLTQRTISETVSTIPTLPIQRDSQVRRNVVEVPNRPQIAIQRSIPSVRINNVPGQTPSANPNNIQLKKLYFYGKCVDLTGWVQNCNKFDRIDPRGNISYYQHCITFKIGENFLSYIHDSKYEVLMRCVQCLPENNMIPIDSYPLEMDLKINDNNCGDILPRIEGKYSTTDLGFRIPYPTNLTPVIKRLIDRRGTINPLSININMTYPVVVKRKTFHNNEKAIFQFALYMKITPGDIIKKILSKPRFPKDKFIEQVVNKFSNSEDIGLEGMIVNLQSSITMTPIKIPFRGKNCKHLFPDDLQTYIETNVKNEKFCCKLCKAPCTPDDIIIDEYFCEILEKHSGVCKIEIFRDGSYKVVEVDNSDDEEIPSKIENKNESRDKKEIEIITIYDSSDEDDCLIVENHTGASETSSNTNKRLTSVIKCNTNQQEASKTPITPTFETAITNDTSKNDQNLINSRDNTLSKDTIQSNQLLINNENRITNTTITCDLNIVDTEKNQSNNFESTVIEQNIMPINSTEINSKKMNELSNSISSNSRKRVSNLINDLNSECSILGPSTSKKPIDCFKFTKEYIASQKAQFKFEPHPSDIFI
uniref:SP-RING-type domain-containing protein n=1 Tax=Parastrongyloides trichosuri TaxID=131310 RepID=A0A0N4ZSI8_PARTI